MKSCIWLASKLHARGKGGWVGFFGFFKRVENKKKKQCLFFLVRESYILCSYFFSGLYPGVYTEAEPCVSPRLVCWFLSNKQFVLCFSVMERLSEVQTRAVSTQPHATSALQMRCCSWSLVSHLLWRELCNISLACSPVVILDIATGIHGSGCVHVHLLQTLLKTTEPSCQRSTSWLSRIKDSRGLTRVTRINCISVRSRCLRDIMKWCINCCSKGICFRVEINVQ